ncbi:zinc finger protein ush [Trichonephila clavipes]|nr:zinc finger protein ush [Trichonephila clavipes]
MHSPGETILKERSKSSDSEAIPKPRQHGEEEILYRCPYCTFMNDDQNVLDKHILSHRHPITKKASSKMTNSKSYCEACRIQFMSIDTYRVHKQMYCKSRNEKGTTSPAPLPESAPGPAFKPGHEAVIIRGGVNGGIASSIIQPQAIYAAISTNPLILLPCSLVNGQGLVSQKAVIPTGAPGIVLQTGIACPTIVEKSPSITKVKEENPPSRKTSHPIMNFSSDSSDRTLSVTSLLRKRKTSEGDVLNLKKTCAGEPVPLVNSDTEKKEPESLPVDQDIPLDLSLKNKLINLSSRSPSKRKNSVASVGSPSPTFPNTSDSISPPRSSILHSRISVSPSSPFNGDMYPYYSSPGVLSRMPHVNDRLSPLPPTLQADVTVDKVIPPAGMPPPKLLKQGDNVCEECQIVFYKYDNYLAHKKHYCAFRRQQLSAIAAAAASSQEQLSDDNNSNHSGHNDSSTSYQSDDASKMVMRRVEHSAEPFRSVIKKSSHSVYCCDACGVKFSTSDNLFAHQTYYCIKKADSAMSKAAASRGDNADSPKGLESPFSGPEEWKCNYCDATCASYDTIRRHLLTHSELRGFRCIVCGYKGNTLRGMKTHACEHLGEATTSIEEFVSNNVIAENGVVPILPPTLDHSDDDSDHSKENKVISRREMAYLERMRERTSSSKRETSSTDHSNELSNSPMTTENVTKEHVPNRISPVKMESSDNSHDVSGSSHQDTVNPLAFCDVVIKAENDHSSSEEDSSKDDPSTPIKYEPEPEYDSDNKSLEGSKSHPGQSTSVIRRASDFEKSEDRLSPVVPCKKKSRTQEKQVGRIDISAATLVGAIWQLLGVGNSGSQKVECTVAEGQDVPGTQNDREDRAIRRVGPLRHQQRR